MAYTPETPAEMERLANYIAQAIKEEIRTARSESIIEDAKGLAKILKVSVATIERKTPDGIIPSFQVWDLRRYDVQRVLDHLHNAGKKEQDPEQNLNR